MQDTSSNNRRIAKNSIFMAIRMLFMLVLTFYSTRIVLETLGVDDYGIYNVVCGFVSLFGFLNLSMSNGIQRFYNFELGKNGKQGAQNVFNVACKIQSILAVIVIILIECIGIWYINNKLVIPKDRLFAAHGVFQCSIFSFICIILQAPFSAAVMAHERMDFYAFVSVFNVLLSVFAAILVPCLNGDNLVIYGVLLGGVNLISLILYIAYCKKNFEEIVFKWRTDVELFLSMLNFSGWNLFGSMSGILREHGVNLIMNLFFGPVVNAARGIASQVNSGLQSFVHNITTPVRPQVIQSYAAGNIERTMKLTYSVSKLSCLFLYMMSLPIISEIDYILKLWLGNNIPDHSSTFVTIVVLTSFFHNLSSAVSGVVHSSGKMKTYQLVGASVNIVALPIVYVALKMGASPEFSLVLVLIITVLNLVACLFVLKTIVDYSIIEYIKQILLPISFVVLSTVWMPWSIVMTTSPSFARLITVGVTSIVGVCVSIFLFGLNNEEKQVLSQLVSKYLKK